MYDDEPYIVALYPLSSPNHNRRARLPLETAVALYPLSSPNHNLSTTGVVPPVVALYPLSSPNHNSNIKDISYMMVALYPLSSPNHNLKREKLLLSTLRYILFHHQTTTVRLLRGLTKCCVISSFITKPQLQHLAFLLRLVALYPLSSPNHNYGSHSPNFFRLRYILFHHQTTTLVHVSYMLVCCVISSFITKPQLRRPTASIVSGCVISSFITKPQRVA